MKEVYCVDFMSKWSNRWVQVEEFDDVYKAIEYAVKVSIDEGNEPHSVRVYDFVGEKTIMRIKR